MPNVNVLSGDYLVSGSYFEVLGTGVIPNLVTSSSLALPTSLSYAPINAIALTAGTTETFAQPYDSEQRLAYTFPGTAPQTAQLARGWYGLFNPWSQSEWDSNPADILWNDEGWENIESAALRNYSEWTSIIDFYNLPEEEVLNRILNTTWVLKVVSANKYFKVKFNNWDQGAPNYYYGPNPQWGADFTPLSFQYTNTGLAINLSFSPSDLQKHLQTQYWTLFTGSNSNGPFNRFIGNNAEQYLSTGIIISSGTWLPNKIPGTNFFAKALIKPLDVERRLNFIVDSGAFALNPKQNIGIGVLSKDAKEKLHVEGGLFVKGNLTVGGGATLSNVSLGFENQTGSRASEYSSILGGRSGIVDSAFSVLNGGFRNQLYGIWNVIGGGGRNLVSGFDLIISNGVGNINFGSGNAMLGAKASSIGIGYPTGSLAAQNRQISGGLIWENYLSRNAYNTIAGGLNSSIYKGIGNFTAGAFRGYTDGYFNNNINGLDNRIYSTSSYNNSIVGGYGNIISKTSLSYWVNGQARPDPVEIASMAEPWQMLDLQGGLSTEPFTPRDVLNRLNGANNYPPQVTAGNTILNGVLNKVTNSRFNLIAYGGMNQIAYCENGDIAGNMNRVYGEQWYDYGRRNYYREGDANSKDIFIRGHRNMVGIDVYAYNRLPKIYPPGGGPNQYGASGVVIFGNEVSTTNNAVAVFSDSRNPFRTTKGNTFHVAHLNGISLGGLGVQLNNEACYSNDLIYWMSGNVGTGAFNNSYWNGEYSPQQTAPDSNGNWTVAQAIKNIETGSQLTPGTRRSYSDRLAKIIPHLTTSSLKRPNYDESPYAEGTYPKYYPDYHDDYYDLSGNLIREFRWDLRRGLGVNIGTLNSLFPAIITAAWPLASGLGSSNFGDPLIDTYQQGGIPILTGVATITPTNSIAIGHRNESLYSDIIVGYQNTRLYQKVTRYTHNSYLGDFSKLPWAKKHTYSREYTPAPSDGYTTIIGGNNTISGASTNVIGYGNNITFSKGLTNLMGMNNEIYPSDYYYPWYQNIVDPQGYIRPVIGGWNYNGWTVFHEAALGNSNIIGNSNGFRTRKGETHTLNVLGNNNLGDDVTRITVVGTSNYVTGLGTKVIGNRNIVMSRESHVLGDENYIQDGLKSIVLGTENVITNVLLNQVDIYNETAPVGSQFTNYGTTNTVPGLPHNYNVTTPNDMVVIGKSNTISELQRTSILGSHNLIEGGKLDLNGEGESNQVIGHNNYSDAKWYVQDYSILGNFNTWDGKTTNLIGSYNLLPASIDTSILGNNNYQKSGLRNSIIIGNDHYVEASDGAAVGTNVYEYNPGQISFSPMNHLKYSNTIGAGQHSASNYDLYGSARGGAAQKTILTWHGIVTGSAAQEIYLDGRSYSPNISSAELAMSRARIPNNRMWNGKLYISIANRGLSYVRNITRGFYMVNQNGTINASSLSAFGTVEDQVTVGSSHGTHNSVASFGAIGDRLVLTTVGIAGQKLVYHVVAEFLDTYVPTTSEDIFGYRLAADGVTRLPVLT